MAVLARRNQLSARRFEEADRLFRQVAADREAADLAAWAVFGSGFTDVASATVPRALDAFSVSRRPLCRLPPTRGFAHGLTLALYTLKQYDQAEKAWADLWAAPAGLGGSRARRPLSGTRGPRPARRSDDAAREFARFAQPGLHPPLTSLLRQGWALRDAGKPAEAAHGVSHVPRRSASPESSASERDWAELGLALTSIASPTGTARPSK